MSRLEFGFSLFQYSLVLVAVGIIISVLMRSAAEGWPPARKWWAYPLLFVCTGTLVLTSGVQFVMFVRALP